MRLFREQLAQAVADPAQVPSGALSEAAQYDDGSDANFLRRLWRDLYPDEPVPHGGNVFEDQYWRDDPDAPFAELLSILEAHCHPEVHAEGYDELKSFVRDPELQERMRLFKEQLAAAVVDPARIPHGALFRAVCYDDGSDEKFLRRMWRDFYPEEPLPRVCVGETLVTGDRQLRREAGRHAPFQRLPGSM